MMDELLKHLIVIMEHDWPNDWEAWEELQKVMARRCRLLEAKADTQGHDYSLGHRDPGTQTYTSRSD